MWSRFKYNTSNSWLAWQHDLADRWTTSPYVHFMMIIKCRAGEPDTKVWYIEDWNDSWVFYWVESLDRIFTCTSLSYPYISMERWFLPCATSALSTSIKASAFTLATSVGYGVWTTCELQEVFRQEYTIHKIHEVWHYPQWSGTLFREYIRENLKLKLEASGWPEYCTNEEEQREFVEQVEQEQGFQLDPDKVKKNAGLRTVVPNFFSSFNL